MDSEKKKNDNLINGFNEDGVFEGHKELEDLVEENVQENEINKNSDIEDIKFRMSEIEVLTDEYERMLYDENTEILSSDEFINLQEEYKELKKLLKQKKKEAPKSSWDKVKPWMLIYAFVQFIICIPFLGVLYRLTYWLYGKLSEWVGNSFTNFPNWLGYTIEVLMMFAFPIINIIISYLLYFNVIKNKFDKKVFFIIWMSQITLTVISMVIIFI